VLTQSLSRNFSGRQGRIYQPRCFVPFACCERYDSRWTKFAHFLEGSTPCTQFFAPYPFRDERYVCLYDRITVNHVFPHCDICVSAMVLALNFYFVTDINLFFNIYKIYIYIFFNYWVFKFLQNFNFMCLFRSVFQHF